MTVTLINLIISSRELSKSSTKSSKFDQKFKKVEESITELKLEIRKGFYNIESKFQTILS
jgi:hypothetical protein